MSSTCISSYEQTPVQIARKWPESDGRFLKPMNKSDGGGGGCRGGVRVVDSKSCRQMYVRSAYTFSRPKENNNVKERAKKCLTRVKDRVSHVYRRGSHDQKTYKVIMRNNSGGRKKGVVVVKKVKEFTCVALFSMVRTLFACTSKV